MLLTLDYATLSDIGGRDSNQDCLGYAEQDALACVVVSDGVGGHAGGEIAARIVVDAILDRFRQGSVFSERALRSHVDFASAQLALRKQQEPALKDMSATVATVMIDRREQSALVAHLGDTRIHVFREGRLLSISRDHSLVQRFIDGGYVTPSQLRSHPLRSTLFAAVGIASDTPVDAVGARIMLTPGDALLLCTDGFWEWLSDEAMEHAFADAGNVSTWLDNMARAACAGNAASGKPRDNASAIAVWCNAPSPSSTSTSTGEPDYPS